MISTQKLRWPISNPQQAYCQIRQVFRLKTLTHVISEEPRMPQVAIDGLRRKLGTAILMVEYGSGGSTILAARLAGC